MEHKFIRISSKRGISCVLRDPIVGFSRAHIEAAFIKELPGATFEYKNNTIIVTFPIDAPLAKRIKSGVITGISMGSSVKV